MLKKAFLAYAVCVAMAASALQAQNLLVSPGVGSTGAQVFAFSTTPLAPITSFTSGAATFVEFSKPDGSKYYAVANSAGQPVTVTNSTFSSAQIIGPFSQAPTGAAMLPDGSKLGVAAGTLHVIDTATDKEVVTNGVNLGTGINAFDVAAGLDGKKFFVLGSNAAGGSQLVAVDTATNAVSGTVPILGIATAVSVGPNGLVYVSTQNQIVEINPSTVAVTAGGPIQLNAKPGKVVFTTDGLFALAPNLTPITGSSVVLISIPQHTQTNFSSGFGVVIDYLLVSGSSTIIGYSSQTRTLFQISVGVTGNLAINQISLPGITTDSVSSVAVSNDVPVGAHTTAQSLFVANAGTVYQFDFPTSAIIGQSILPTGNAAGAMTVTGAAATGTPVTLLTYGNNQIIAPSATSAPLVVQVLDANNKPLIGIPVTFAINSGTGTLSTTSVTTGANGNAITYYTAQATNGPVVVGITAGTQTGSFSITVGTGTGGGGGGAAGTIKIVAGQGEVVPEGQNTSSFAGSGFGSPLQVLVTDVAGNPVSGAQITYTIAQGNGALIGGISSGASTVITSDNLGIASADFLTTIVGANGTGFSQAIINVTGTLPSGAATNAVNFFVSTVPRIPPVTIRLLAPNAGDVLTGQAGTTLKGALLVQVASGAGQGIPNVGLFLSNGGLDPAQFPSASCSDPNGTGVLSDANGNLVCDLVFGGKLGTGSIVGNVGYYATTNPFTIVVTPGPPGAVKIVQGNNQTGSPGQQLPLALRVQITDTFGNVLPNVPVTWQVLTAGGVTLSNISSASDSVGNASALATLGNIAGTVQVKVTAGSASATFTLTVNIPTAGIQKVSGDSQNALINTAFPAPLVVKVVDAQGAAVNGATVTFSVTSGSASLGSASATTNATGQASTTVTAGGTAGNIVITATASGFSVTFALSSRLPGATNCVFLNGASFQSGISPGSIATLTCNGIGTTAQGLVTSFSIIGPLSTTLAGVSLTFNGATAPIYYVLNTGSQQTIAFQVPFEVQAGTASVVISGVGGGSTTISTTVQAYAPGVFETQYGTQKVAVALRPDGSFVSPSNPAHLGERIRIYVTGAGQVSPASATNEAGVPGQAVTGALTVGLNNGGIVLASAEYAQGLVGVYVLTIQVPANTQTGPAQPFGFFITDAGGNQYFAPSTFLPIQ